jgi:hypothetical protein
MKKEHKSFPDVQRNSDIPTEQTSITVYSRLILLSYVRRRFGGTSPFILKSHLSHKVNTIRFSISAHLFVIQKRILIKVGIVYTKSCRENLLSSYVPF